MSRLTQSFLEIESVPRFFASSCERIFYWTIRWKPILYKQEKIAPLFIGSSNFTKFPLPFIFTSKLNVLMTFSFRFVFHSRLAQLVDIFAIQSVAFDPFSLSILCGEINIASNWIWSKQQFWIEFVFSVRLKQARYVSERFKAAIKGKDWSIGLIGQTSFDISDNVQFFTSIQSDRRDLLFKNFSFAHSKGYGHGFFFFICILVSNFCCFLLLFPSEILSALSIERNFLPHIFPLHWYLLIVCRL